MKGVFLQSFREVCRRKAASLLVCLCVLVGTASLLLFSSLGDKGSRQITGELTETGLLGLQITRNDKSGLPPLGESQLAALQSLDTVKKASPVITTMGEASAAGKSGSCVLWGAGTGAEQSFSLTLLHGRLLQDFDLAEEEKVCLADKQFALAYFGRENIVGKRITITFGGKKGVYEVVGVVASGGALTQGILGSFVPFFLYLPYPQMQSTLSGDGFSQLAAQLVESEDREALIRQTLAALEEATGEPNGFSAEDLTKRSGAVEGVLQLLGLMLSAMGALTLLVAGISILLMMHSSVRERRVEIGIQIALGATKGRIAFLFLFEAAFLAFLGSVGGILLAAVSLFVLSSLLGLDFTLSPSLALFSLPAITLFGGLCGLVPSLLAAKSDPAAAFRSL